MSAHQNGGTAPDGVSSALALKDEQAVQVDPRVVSFLTNAGALSDVLEVLVPVLLKRTLHQQRFLCELVSWRLLNRHLPASQNMPSFPMLAGLTMEEIEAAVTPLLDTGTLKLAELELVPGSMAQHGFIWPAFEKSLAEAIQGLGAPKLVDVAGGRLRR